jgi:hypothetical protein
MNRYPTPAMYGLKDEDFEVGIIVGWDDDNAVEDWLFYNKIRNNSFVIPVMDVGVWYFLPKGETSLALLLKLTWGRSSSVVPVDAQSV